MRLSMLLDIDSQAGPVTAGRLPSTPTTDARTAHASTTTPQAAAQSERREFALLVAGLLPCRNNDPELWFAEQTAAVEQAKAMCRECPLMAGCLAGAIERAEPWGVWGGEVFVDGRVVATKRGRGRPRKVDVVVS